MTHEGAASPEPPAPAEPPIAIPIDSLADAALARMRDAPDLTETTCDACDCLIEGEPASRGLFVTTRGGEVRYGEPPLCGACAVAIGMKIKVEAEIEEEEG